MSATRHDDGPWWSSGAEGLDDADPFERHRQARAGQQQTDGPPPSEVWWQEAADLLGRVVREAGRARDGAPRHDPTTCGICPVCAGLRALGDARPEVIRHLGEASRHLTLAVKALVDAHADTLEGEDRLERIDLDDEE